MKRSQLGQILYIPLVFENRILPCFLLPTLLFIKIKNSGGTIVPYGVTQKIRRNYRDTKKSMRPLKCGMARVIVSFSMFGGFWPPSNYTVEARGWLKLEITSPKIKKKYFRVFPNFDFKPQKLGCNISIGTPCIMV